MSLDHELLPADLDGHRDRVPEPSAPAPASDAPAASEVGYAEVLAAVLGVDRVPVDSNFFDDLGADSMLMARFCARVRKRDDLPSVAMKDVYQHPTVAPARPRESRVRPRPRRGRLRRGAGRASSGWTGCRWTATSSTTWAPTRCSWPASAPG